MHNLFSRILIGLILTFVIFFDYPSLAIAQTDPTQLAKAVAEIENLDAMRSELASTLKDSTTEPTVQTFKEVCQPVGMRAKQLSQENGWQVKQIAQKYRNPAHKPDNLPAQMALAKFDRDLELMGFWDRETIAGESGTHYYRRINIESSCLACHGGKNSRPQFIQDKYPQDLAYDFKEGDLRGMYSVFIPNLQAALLNSQTGES